MAMIFSSSPEWDTTLPVTNGAPRPKPKPWERPKTGAQFGHLSLGERVFCPPLLLHRLRELKVALPKLQVVYDRVVVYPLEGIDKEETFEGTTIIKATASITKQESSRGLLVRAGMGALEQLWSHGIEIGHIVLCARLSPWEREYTTKDGTIRRVMLLRASDIVGSEDLEEDIAEGCVDYEMGADGRIGIKERVRTDPPENDEGI